MHRILLLLTLLLTAACASATPCDQARALNASCELPAQEDDVEGLDVCQGSSASAAACALKHPEAYCAFTQAPAAAAENAYLRCVQDTVSR
jgi:hypothetical protein